MILFCLYSCRVEEVSNPGPPDVPEAQSFVIGSLNPSGLRNKSHFVSSQLAQGGVWAVSETHLDRKELMKFRKGLACSDSLSPAFDMWWVDIQWNHAQLAVVHGKGLLPSPSST